jgi:transcriptional regulator with XRE-family HTH domain
VGRAARVDFRAFAAATPTLKGRRFACQVLKTSNTQMFAISASRRAAVDFLVRALQHAFTEACVIDRTEFCARFGRLLAARREEANLSQRQFARAIHLSRTSVANIERGRQAVNLHTLYVMADALQRDIADLMPTLGEVTAKLRLPRKQLSKLSSQERRQLRKLTAPESNWLNKIAHTGSDRL